MAASVTARAEAAEGEPDKPDMPTDYTRDGTH